MSKNGKINQVNYSVEFPEIHILQYSLISRQTIWNNPNRNAPFWRFYKTLTPGARIIFEGKEIKLCREKVVLLPPNLAYASFVDRPFSQFYIHFTWNIGSVIRNPIILNATDPVCSFRDVKKIFESNEILFPVKIYAILLKYLAEISENLTALEATIDPRVLKAVQLINQKNTCRNSEISHALYMSCDNLQRLFKREMGISMRQYLIARRMEKAQMLLENFSFSIEEIASQTGFSDRYQFTKTFSSFFKTSPGVYRKKLKQ